MNYIGLHILKLVIGDCVKYHLDQYMVIGLILTSKVNMWADIHIISKKSDHDNGVVMIGALRNEENDKLYYNTKRNERKGGREILDLSDNEIKDLKEIYLTSFMIALRNSGFRL